MINLDSESIDLIFSYYFTYVKLCGISTALTVPNLSAVDPKMVGTVHALESETVQDIISPTNRDREIGLVQARWVLRRNEWRVRGKWVIEISIVWMTIALELPMTWSVSDQIPVEMTQTVRRAQSGNALISSFVHSDMARIKLSASTMEHTW